MPTLHLSLISALHAVVQQALGENRAHIDLPTPVDKDMCPCAVVELGPTEFQPIGTQPDGYDQLRASVELIVKVHTRGAPHTQVADPTVATVHQAVMADPSLGGQALRLSITGTRPRMAAGGDGTVGMFELRYRATVVADERTLAIVAT